MTDHDEAAVVLTYTVGGTPTAYTVMLEAMPCPYGGVRWWWICPVSGRRAAKLHLAPGGRRVAARQVCRLAYQSDRDGGMQRARNRLRRLFARLGSAYEMAGDEPPPRPRGMHRATYNRLLGAIWQAEDRHDGAFVATAERFFRRVGPRAP